MPYASIDAEAGDTHFEKKIRRNWGSGDLPVN
jgi:hypothetical protein